MTERRKFVNIFRSEDGTLIALDDEGKAWKRTKTGSPPLTSESKGKWERFLDWDAPRKPYVYRVPVSEKQLKGDKKDD